MNISECEYKLTIAMDMIYYLTKLLLYNSPDKSEMISQILNKWDARVSANIERIRCDQAKILAKQANIEIDVASILISIQQTEINILKNEFKKDIEKVIQGNEI